MHNLKNVLLLQAALLIPAGFVLAQPAPPSPPTAPASNPDSSDAEETAPDPTGVVNQVEVRGKVLRGYGHEFYPDGDWIMWDETGEPVGWGTWEQDDATGDIDYVNESGDGGGGQTGTYEWDPSEGVWERTEASHPDAPPLRLLPPL